MNRIRLYKSFRAASALLLLWLVLISSGCRNSTDNAPSYAYLGGEIINPTTDHIVIKRNGKVLDTILLDEKNQFSYTVDSAENGLYVIHHKPELQNIYLSPGDSLLLRANTLAFDESLHFSGKGKAKNNFMAAMFLDDEDCSQILLSFHKYTPTQFLKKADSVKQERINYLEQVAEKKKFTPEFMNLATQIINYENHDLKERYTFLVKKYSKEYSRQFPDNFHAYREDVDFNSEPLQCSPGYKRFVENYLINNSLSWCATSGLDSADCSSLTNVDNVNARLRKAGELIQLPTLRQKILTKIAVRGLVTATSKENLIAILKELQNQNLSEEDLEEMRQLGSIQLAYLPGTTLNDVRLLDMKGQYISLDSVIKKPSVIFLWSAYKGGHVEEHKLINELRRKYPSIDFIGVNLDTADEPAWRVAVRNNNYNPEYEYQLAQTRINNEFFEYFLDKMLFLSATGEVVFGDTFLTSSQFESRILEFINQ